MKRLLVLLSLATAFALVACQNRGREGSQPQEPNQPGSQAEPGSDVRTAYPDDEGSSATDRPGQPQGGTMANPDDESNPIGADPSEQQNQPSSD
jgi:hypothetical protein